MKIADIKVKAKKMGVNPEKKDKLQLIREIQTKEGNRPCFQTEISKVCGIMQCLWRDDCVGIKPN